MADSLVVQHAEKIMRRVHGAPGEQCGAIAEIDRSWKRCVEDYRLDPSRLYAPTVIDPDNIKEREERHTELIEIARIEMDSLYDQTSGSGFALLLADADGVILCEKVDPALRQMFRSAGLIVGAEWSEAREGTNGIGTCLIEGHATTVHRAEHFRARHIGLSCTGAPIRDSAGDLLAVLDASNVDTHDTRASQTHTMALVSMSAYLIEKCLFLRRHQRCAVLRFHHRPELVNLLHDGALALSEDGTVVAADATAGKLLGTRNRRELVGRSIAELFDIGVDELLSASAVSRRAILPLRDLRNGRAYYANLVDPPSAERRHAPAPARDAPEVMRFSPAPTSEVLSLDRLAGQDSLMLRNARSARRVANSSVPVLLSGPTGSGKEAFAKALHLASDRAERAFVAINCAAIPESLIESELFGYKAGAFTGARKEGMRGKILQASGGTLFLDEIGDMPLLLQTRLLRVLEEHEVVPLGSETPIKVELRVISASHRRLRDMIAAGSFREDLYYRLNGITLELPSLAEREDKERLIHEFIARETGNRPAAIEMEAMQLLTHHAWPGNIRELRNVIRTALTICEGGLIRLADLPREVRTASPVALLATASAAPAHVPDPVAAAQSNTVDNPLKAAEREALLKAIESNRWNMSNTALQLGMSRNTLYRKIKQHAIPLAPRVEWRDARVAGTPA